MSQYQIPLPPEKKRKILIFGIVPVLLLLLAVLLYVQFSTASAGNKPTTNKLNLSIPDHSKVDSAARNKSDLYTMLEDREKKDSENKAVFNTDDKLNLNTDVKTDQDLKNRLDKEVAKSTPRSTDPSARGLPAHDIQFIPSSPKTPLENTGDASFNSIVIPNEEDKKPTFANPTAPGKDADINCAAVVSRKTKIADGGSVTMELVDDLPAMGKTLPKGSLVTGIARLEQTRITLRINTINLNGKIISVRLSAYDMDGVEGLRMPGNMALKRGANQTVNDQIDAVGANAESQLSGLGGRMVGGVIRNIVHGGGKKDEATIPAGYKLILKND